ncbi:hypothetical protein HK104_003240, partial [Borealophlyctis nickersoniae]
SKLLATAGSDEREARGDRDWMKGGAWEGDVEFVQDAMMAVQSHMGELFVRQKFHEHVQHLVNIAASYEMDTMRSTQIALTPSNTGSPELGVGPYFLDDALRRKEIVVLRNRVDGWRASTSYIYYQRDFQTWIRRRALRSFDAQHLVARLRWSQNLSDAVTVRIFLVFQDIIAAGNDEQVVELLGLLPQNQGGLYPIASGLFCGRWEVRRAVTRVLKRVSDHPTGAKFLVHLNPFLRFAYERGYREFIVAAEIEDMEQPKPAAGRRGDNRLLPEALTPVERKESLMGKDLARELPSGRQTSGSGSASQGSRFDDRLVPPPRTVEGRVGQSSDHERPNGSGALSSTSVGPRMERSASGSEPRFPPSAPASSFPLQPLAPTPSSPIVRKLLLQQQQKHEQLRAKLGAMQTGPNQYVEDTLNPDFAKKTLGDAPAVGAGTDADGQLPREDPEAAPSISASSPLPLAAPSPPIRQGEEGASDSGWIPPAWRVPRYVDTTTEANSSPSPPLSPRGSPRASRSGAPRGLPPSNIPPRGPSMYRQTSGQTPLSPPRTDPLVAGPVPPRNNIPRRPVPAPTMALPPTPSIPTSPTSVVLPTPPELPKAGEAEFLRREERRRVEGEERPVSQRNSRSFDGPTSGRSRASSASMSGPRRRSSYIPRDGEPDDAVANAPTKEQREFAGTTESIDSNGNRVTSWKAPTESAWRERLEANKREYSNGTTGERDSTLRRAKSSEWHRGSQQRTVVDGERDPILGNRRVNEVTSRAPPNKPIPVAPSRGGSTKPEVARLVGVLRGGSDGGTSVQTEGKSLEAGGGQEGETRRSQDVPRRLSIKVVGGPAERLQGPRSATLLKVPTSIGGGSPTDEGERVQNRNIPVPGRHGSATATPGGLSSLRARIAALQSAPGIAPRLSADGINSLPDGSTHVQGRVRSRSESSPGSPPRIIQPPPPQQPPPGIPPALDPPAVTPVQLPPNMVTRRPSVEAFDDEVEIHEEDDDGSSSASYEEEDDEDLYQSDGENPYDFADFYHGGTIARGTLERGTLGRGGDGS